ncbi:MAG TPA: peptide-methionine (R)-S-oxide reductase MsrB [Pirellulales bacterium]|nr:peptide-methionine (R)-S-oxide reductase MsrB [Pirellulales bacterium]
MLRRSKTTAFLAAMFAAAVGLVFAAALLAAPKSGKRPPPREKQAAAESEADNERDAADDEEKPVRKTDREWKRLLTGKQYRVTRQRETEPPFSGKYVHTKKEGVYRCVCCGSKLFASQTKFDSGTGWPSFYAPLREKALRAAPDYSDGTPRVEVTCARCEAHLGHVFGDGPQPTGLRYCVNSASLKLDEQPGKDGKPAK